ncbi:expressed protein [Dictyostelium purpureum]|uniref:Expressed protein n=1 Tax=Dictyostelium purpureum TaxID=5786 RepID=F0ZLA9_DICPU|nr:uncharacterized protein DICPUDRAFT_92055 [Dictyostelium purpureum]EGC35271.1 expressed protein [Dictyostelium purpureum]|eukprot:XP_003288197.1 expressed protein [Dictyostelium purpureum]
MRVLVLLVALIFLSRANADYSSAFISGTGCDAAGVEVKFDGTCVAGCGAYFKINAAGTEFTRFTQPNCADSPAPGPQSLTCVTGNGPVSLSDGLTAQCIDTATPTPTFTYNGFNITGGSAANACSGIVYYGVVNGPCTAGCGRYFKISNPYPKVTTTTYNIQWFTDSACATSAGDRSQFTCSSNEVTVGDYKITCSTQGTPAPTSNPTVSPTVTPTATTTGSASSVICNVALLLVALLFALL